MAIAKKGVSSGSDKDVMSATQGILYKLSYDKMYSLLKSLCKSDSVVMVSDASGKELVDFPATLSLIRTKCRQTLDDVDALENYFKPRED